MIFLFISEISAFVIANILSEFERTTVRWVSPLLIVFAVWLFFNQIKYHRCLSIFYISLFLTELLYSFICNLSDNYFLIFKISNQSKLQNFLKDHRISLLAAIISFSLVLNIFIMKVLKQKGIYMAIYAANIAFTAKAGYKQIINESLNVSIRLLTYFVIFVWSMISFLKMPLISYLFIINGISLLLAFLGIEFLFDLGWNLCANVSTYAYNEKKPAFPNLIVILTLFLLVLVAVETKRRSLIKKRNFKIVSDELFY